MRRKIKIQVLLFCIVVVQPSQANTFFIRVFPGDGSALVEAMAGRVHGGYMWQKRCDDANEWTDDERRARCCWWWKVHDQEKKVVLNIKLSRWFDSAKCVMCDGLWFAESISHAECLLCICRWHKPLRRAGQIVIISDSIFSFCFSVWYDDSALPFDLCCCCFMLAVCRLLRRMTQHTTMTTWTYLA